jgi:hypothetical protein
VIGPLKLSRTYACLFDTLNGIGARANQTVSVEHVCKRFRLIPLFYSTAPQAFFVTDPTGDMSAQEQSMTAPFRGRPKAPKGIDAPSRVVGLVLGPSRLNFRRKIGSISGLIGMLSAPINTRIARNTQKLSFCARTRSGKRFCL